MYFSLRSPYSWLAFLKLRDSAGPLSSTDRWIPFWQPESPSLKERLEKAGADLIYSPMTMPKIFYGMMDIRRHAEALGIETSRPKESRDGWDAPHLAFLTARAAGDGKRFLAAVFSARWEKGLDICRKEVLEDIVAESGGHGGWMSEAVYDAAAEGLVRACQDRVFGVPYFVLAGEGYWGIHRLEYAMADSSLAELERRTRMETEPGIPGNDRQGKSHDKGVNGWEKSGTAFEEGALEGIPMEILRSPGCLDWDHAGGCG